jgi:hypothetical protein
VAPWKKIFEAAKATGGIEYYLIEQEGGSPLKPRNAAWPLEAAHVVEPSGNAIIPKAT